MDEKFPYREELQEVLGRLKVLNAFEEAVRSENLKVISEILYGAEVDQKKIYRIVRYLQTGER